MNTMLPMKVAVYYLDEKRGELYIEAFDRLTSQGTLRMEGDEEFKASMLRLKGKKSDFEFFKTLPLRLNGYSHAHFVSLYGQSDHEADPDLGS
ncbi:MAG: hypothetical protein RLZZ511_4459 [Cyanobacteriota bacterium]